MIIRTDHLNPRLSTYTHLDDTLHFNQTTNASPYTNVFIHENPDQRPTRFPHAIIGFYLGPAMYRYIYYRVWVNNTQVERIADIMAWFPTKVVIPVPGSIERTTAATQDLTAILRRPAKSISLYPVSLDT